MFFAPYVLCFILFFSESYNFSYLITLKSVMHINCICNIYIHIYIYIYLSQLNILSLSLNIYHLIFIKALLVYELACIELRSDMYIYSDGVVLLFLISARNHTGKIPRICLVKPQFNFGNPLAI